MYVYVYICMYLCTYINLYTKIYTHAYNKFFFNLSVCFKITLHSLGMKVNAGRQLQETNVKKWLRDDSNWD